jgi:two-component system cell cycle response regulator DivK
MNKTILIVDDDQRNIFALSALLKANRYTVASATGMEEATALLKEPKGVGIILMDMMMPGMDGYEAVRMLKGEERYKHIPVVAVTAQAMPGDREKCLAAGADDYLSKPVDVDRLIALLNQFLK